MYWCSLLSLALICLRCVGSEDLYWRPNTNWSNPSNWGLGRVPCEADVADFSSVPGGSVIKLDTNTVVRSVILPAGSRLELGRSITLRLSNSKTCQIPSSGGPVVAEVKENNTFIGTEPRYWESAKNWESVDGEDAKSAPCGKDRAFFRDGQYSPSVISNFSSVSVQYLHVRQNLVTTELIPEVAPELKLNLTVDPRCGEDPSLCPCFPSRTTTPRPSSSFSSSSKGDGSTVKIVVPVLVVVVLIVTGAVALAVLWLWWRKKSTYQKDELLGEPDDSLHSASSATGTERGALFDNPIYEMGVVKSKSDGNEPEDKEATEKLEKQTIAMLRPSGDYEPVDYVESTTTSEPDKKVPILEEYERHP